MKISEAKKLLQTREWVLIQSEKFDGPVFLKRHKNVVIQDNEYDFSTGSGYLLRSEFDKIKEDDNHIIPQFTIDEIKLLRELPEDGRECFLKAMHHIKSVFEGAYMVFEKGRQNGLR